MREELRVDLYRTSLWSTAWERMEQKKTAQHVRNVNAIEIVSATIQSSGMRLYEKSYH